MTKLLIPVLDYMSLQIFRTETPIITAQNFTLKPIGMFVQVFGYITSDDTLGTDVTLDFFAIRLLGHHSSGISQTKNSTLLAILSCSLLFTGIGALVETVLYFNLFNGAFRGSLLSS